jgi:hypothetical protein
VADLTAERNLARSKGDWAEADLIRSARRHRGATPALGGKKKGDRAPLYRARSPVRKIASGELFVVGRQA